MSESFTLFGYEVEQVHPQVWLIMVDGTLVPLAYSELKELGSCKSKEAFKEALVRIRAPYTNFEHALAVSLKMLADGLDYVRLKKQIADAEGVRNSVDDILTNKATAELSMEDTHEELP